MDWSFRIHGTDGSLLRSTGVRDNNNIALLLYGLPCKEKVINLQMASGMAETYRWEKLCKDILIIKI